ncbi:MAG TPA: hypothetical protein VES59_02610 [Bacteroidota bacterium]|nr:hypothetical protein [Bacteroidota bacterium]
MRSYRFLPIFALALPFTVCHPQGKESALVAAPYPGSITEPPADASSEPNSQTFYTKDSIEKVKAHYTKSLGEFEKTSTDNSNTVYFREAIPSNTVMDILVKRGVELGESRQFAGITLSAWGINPNVTVVNVLDRLKSAYLMRFNTPDVEDYSTVSKHLDDAELKQTIARYEHAEFEYFPLAKEKHMDEIIYEKYYVAPEEAVAKEQQELVKKMTVLTTQGKYDEATKVGDRMTQLSGRHSDARMNWDTAVKCLQELEKNAYPTKIVIDKHPSKWDLSSFTRK